tara:strand:+ start:216 stop:407 length:192 start_codon:yes stop_codon:yes gene_type:complete
VISEIVGVYSKNYYTVMEPSDGLGYVHQGRFAVVATVAVVYAVRSVFHFGCLYGFPIEAPFLG